MKKYNETQLRTFFKVVSWRVVITIIHLANALIATGNLMLGLQIAGLATVINSILFWAHERTWNLFIWNRRAKNSSKFTEGNPRSISKMLSWRLLITSSNFFIPFIITGSWGSAVIFAGLATVINMFTFWAHERAWNKINYGKQTNASQ